MESECQYIYNLQIVFLLKYTHTYTNTHIHTLVLPFKIELIWHLSKDLWFFNVTKKTFKKKQPQSVKYQNYLFIFIIEGELYYLTHHLQIYKHLLKVTHDKLFSWLLPIVTPNVKIYIFFLFNLPSFLCMTVFVSGQINCTSPHHIFFFFNYLTILTPF